MKRIPLTQGKFALVDDEDFERVGAFKWRVSRKRGNSYAKRDIVFGKQGSKYLKVCVAMHRVILSPPDGSVVDHINGDGLDNRRANLRVCTNSQNSQNRDKPRSNTTGFKGVSPKDGRRFVANIEIRGKKIHLGCFADAVSAAKVYDAAAKRIHGPFARLNFSPHS